MSAVSIIRETLVWQARASGELDDTGYLCAGVGAAVKHTTALGAFSLLKLEAPFESVSDIGDDGRSVALECRRSNNRSTLYTVVGEQEDIRILSAAFKELSLH